MAGSETTQTVRTIGAGAGFAGDRIEPAVALAASGVVQTVVLECLAERTLVPALRARQADPEAGADPRLRRRLTPLLPVAHTMGCRIVSNLGAANPAAAGRAIATLAGELGCRGLRVAAVVGDDVMALGASIAWEESPEGKLLGAHAYLGTEGLCAAVEQGADVVVAGRVADSALFAADLLPHLDPGDAALAGATAVGHLLECAGQLTGGNFEPPGGGGLAARDFAVLGYPLAHVARDGSAEITILDGAPGLVDPTTCTLQLLYEVHDPAHYITPDVTIDFTGIRFAQTGPNRVRMSGARAAGRPSRLKVAGFVDRPGMIADVEIGFAGHGAFERARSAAAVLRLRLADWPAGDVAIDLVGIDSILRAASAPTLSPPAEARVHVSARCADLDAAQLVEDEVYALTLSGPAGGGSVRSERRPRLEVITGFIPRELVRPRLVWTEAP
jgi:hypothetical protein